nr:hypothetical transcript [Hymenolepis microstoma]
MRKLKRNEKLKSLSPNNLENGKESIANSVAALTRQSSDLTPSPSQGASNEPFVDLNQRTPGENPCTNRIGVDEITCELDERPPSGTRHLCNRPPSRPLDNARCSEFLANEQGTNINGVASNSISLNLEDSEDEESKRHVKFEGDYSNNDDGSRSESGDDGDDDYTEVNKKADKAIQEGHGHHTHGHHHHGHGHRHHSHHHGHSRRGPLHPSKPHGHHHGHSHDLSSVKAIAWTIVVGDGLHNFCDGIAIGASFAVDMNGGISTALAVLCHELPHELGDFAVLLHAGMSAKTALFYNTLSSILCAAGMVLGVLLGSMPTVNLWLFLLTAGMFVYIALVDMMPELTTSRMHGYRTCHLPTVLFFWQNMGMVIGVVIMLVIAKFEKHMSNTF